MQLFIISSANLNLFNLLYNLFYKDEVAVQVPRLSCSQNRSLRVGCCRHGCAMLCNHSLTLHISKVAEVL